MKKKDFKYSKGYVAFIDILGISDFMKDDKNGCGILNLYHAIGRIQDLFNNMPELSANIAVFSDSVIITTNRDFRDFILPINILERYLYEETGLLYRGGITYGDYYHERNIAFGPALIKAHKLETTAEYSRIVIDEETIPIYEGDLWVFRDFDTKWCINPYGMHICDEMNSDVKEKNTTDYIDIDVISLLVKSLVSSRDRILNTISGLQLELDENVKTKAIIKNMWRIIPFNYTCDYILNYPEEIEYLRKLNHIFTEDERAKITDLKIKMSDIVTEYGYM